MPRNLRYLPGVELGVNILRQRLILFLQAADFFRNIQCGIVLHEAQFFNLGFELRNWLLEIQKGGFHVGTHPLNALKSMMVMAVRAVGMTVSDFVSTRSAHLGHLALKMYGLAGIGMIAIDNDFVFRNIGHGV